MNAIEYLLTTVNCAKDSVAPPKIVHLMIVHLDLFGLDVVQNNISKYYD